MSKHTKAAWIAVAGMVELESDTKPDICSCYPGDFRQGHLKRSAEQVYANARLCSAAPDMLAALIAARDYLSCIPESAAGGDDDAVRLCRDADYAIAKATGGES